MFFSCMCTSISFSEADRILIKSFRRLVRQTMQYWKGYELTEEKTTSRLVCLENNDNTLIQHNYSSYFMCIIIVAHVHVFRELMNFV